MSSPPDACAVTCTPPGYGTSVMASLPRIGTDFKAVTSELGWYEWFDCTQDAGQDWSSCSWTSIKPNDFGPGGAAADHSPVAYAQSIGMYIVLAVLLSVIVCVTCLVCACARCRCCFCSRLGACGGVKPTPRSSCTKLGFDRLTGGRAVYSRRGRVAARMFMLSFVIATVAIVYVGQAKGNGMLASTLRQIATSPTPLVGLMRRVQEPLASSLQTLAATVLVPAMTDIRNTFTSNLNLPLVQSNVECVIQRTDTLPDPAVLQTFISDVNASVVSVTDLRPEFESVLTTLNNTVETVPGLLQQTAGAIVGINGSLSDLLVSVDEVQVALADTTIVVTALNDSSTGIAALSANLTILADDGSYPSPSTISNVTDNPSLPSTLSKFMAGTMDGTQNDPDRTSLVAKLQALVDDLDGLPDAGSTSDGIEAVEEDVGFAETTFPVLEQGLTGMNTSLAAIVPNMLTINSSVTDIQTSLDAINLAVVRDLIRALNTTLVDFPSPDPVRTQLDVIMYVIGVVPCFQTLTDELVSVNETLLRLPSGIDVLPGVLTDLNSTIEANLPLIQDFNNTLNDVVATLHHDAKTSIDDFDDRVNEFQADLDDARSVFDDVTADIETALDQRADIDFESVISEVSSLNASLHDPGLGSSEEVRSALGDLDSILSQVTDLLVDGVDAIDSFASGRCDTGSSVAVGSGCSSSADCGGTGVCRFAVRRCADSFATACPNGLDTECPTGHCLYNAGQFANLTAALNALATTRPSFDASGLEAGLTSIEASLNNLPDLDATLHDVSDLESALKDFPVQSTVDDVDAAIHDIQSLNVNEVTADFDSLWSSIDDLPDFDTLSRDVDDLNGPINDVADHRHDLVDAQTLVEGVSSFLNDNVPKYLDDFGSGTLLLKEQQGGLPLLVRWMAASLDDVVAGLNNITQSISTPTSLSVNVTDKVQPAMRVLDIVHGTDDTRYGPYYFLAELMDVDFMVPLAESDGGRVMVDSNGNDYPDDKVCVTTACIDASISYYTSQTLMKTTNGRVPIALPAPLALGLPYALPLMVAFVGFLAFMLSCCGTNYGTKTLSCCVASCSLCLVPALFISAGAIMFPILMVFSDSCTNGNNIAYQYAAGDPHAVCTTAGLTYNVTSAQCSLPVHNSHVQVSPSVLLASLMGSCDAGMDVVGNTYTEQLWTAAGDAASSLPVDRITEELAKLGDKEFAPRAALRSDILTAAHNAADAVQSISDTMSSTLSCAELGQGLQTIQNGFCDDFMTALYFSLASWYLVTWALCLCGAPAGILGVKRLPQTLAGQLDEKAPQFEVIQEPLLGGGYTMAPNPAMPSRQYHPFHLEEQHDSPTPRRPLKETTPLLSQRPASSSAAPTYSAPTPSTPPSGSGYGLLTDGSGGGGGGGGSSSRTLMYPPPTQV